MINKDDAEQSITPPMNLEDDSELTKEESLAVFYTP